MRDNPAGRRGVPSLRRCSCGLAMVEVEHTSETLPAHDAAACGSVVIHRCDEHVAERLMVSLDVIVSGELSDELAQVAFAQALTRV
jgi:hypothetical protein